MPQPVSGMAVIIRIMTKTDITGFAKSRISPESYFRWRLERCSEPVKKMDQLHRLNQSNVLDIGCGFGSLSYLLSDMGAHVHATETDARKMNQAKKFLKGRNIDLKLVRDEILPYGKGFFDAVFMFDVIEHVADPQAIINEVFRTLKPGGYVYIEFTPYYSVVGHHLYDYAKWPIHILPRKFIWKYVYSRGNIGFLTADDLWRQFESLNKLKISTFQKMIGIFRKIRERYIVKYPDKFEVNIPFIGYLPFKDLLTMSFEGIYRKI